MAIRVCVIGSGAAGLVALRHLTHRSHLFQAVAFEQSSKLGGTWVYTDRIEKDENNLPVHSSMYKNLRTNLPKEVMAFPDFPFSDSLPSFIHHADVLNYLEDYADHFDVRKYIHFNTIVKDVTPKQCEVTNKTKWSVEVQRHQESSELLEFDAVIVCTGHYSVPLVPKIPGLETFKGKQIHSHSYRKPEDFQNESILCLGAGPSGTDIMLDISQCAKKVYLSHRKSPLKSELPHNIVQVGGIANINGDIVKLEDGKEIEVDTLLFCTGYHYVFPFLNQKCHLNIIGGKRIMPLYRHLIHTEFSTLSIIGILNVICPFPLFDCQIRYFLATLDGSLVLPSREGMNAKMEADFESRLAVGMPPRHAHHMGPKQWAYNDTLAEEAGFKKIQPVVKMLYDAVHDERAKCLAEYKNLNYRFVSENSFIQV